MCLDEAFLGPKYSDLTTWWQNYGPTKTRELIRAPDTTGEPTVAFRPIISPRWGLDPKIWNTWTQKTNKGNNKKENKHLWSELSSGYNQWDHRRVPTNYQSWLDSVNWIIFVIVGWHNPQFTRCWLAIQDATFIVTNHVLQQLAGLST